MSITENSADINQIRSDDGGTVTGRFSYSNPPFSKSLKQKIGPLIGYFTEQDCVWGVTIHNKNQDLLYIVPLSQLRVYRGSWMNTINDADFHQAVAEMVDIDRMPRQLI